MQIGDPEYDFNVELMYFQSLLFKIFPRYLGTYRNTDRHTYIHKANF